VGTRRVATFVVVIGALLAPAVPAQGAVIQRFWIGEGSVPTDVPDLKYVIDKGPSDVGTIHSLGAQAINYEQSFMLNSEEAAYARARGWLAQTCSGAEIRSTSAPVTMMDPTIPEAREWRTTLVADETNSGGYDGSYLDNIRAVYVRHHFTGDPDDRSLPGCQLISNDQWAAASADVVNLMEAKTGKMAIINGNPFGSGNAYFEHQALADVVMNQLDPALGSGVHIERWGTKNSANDPRFMDVITGRGLQGFAKCDASASTCTNLFNRALRPELRYLHL
jgi:hypothetical protein